MDKLKRDSVVIWTVGSIKLVVTYSELINYFLQNQIPYTTRKLTREMEGKIITIISDVGGQWMAKNIKSMRNYKKIPLTQLQQLKNCQKLGAGVYATVYLCGDKAVKVISHKFYKNLPQIDGQVEADIMKVLREEITFNFYSPNIINMYQYTNDKKIDYIVLEKLDKTLWSYIREKPPDIKAVILQVIFTLAVIQKVLPDFRHNDLKVDNILLDFSPRSADLVLRYEENYWHIPQNAPLVKISDFDYSCIPDVIDNPKVTTDHSASFGCTGAPNHVYDVHLFMNSLYSYREKLGREIKDWLLEQLPETTRGSEAKDIKYSRLRQPEKWTEKINTPQKLLTDNFFSTFKTKKRASAWGLK